MSDGLKFFTSVLFYEKKVLFTIRQFGNDFVVGHPITPKAQSGRYQFSNDCCRPSLGLYVFCFCFRFPTAHALSYLLPPLPWLTCQTAVGGR